MRFVRHTASDDGEHDLADMPFPAEGVLSGGDLAQGVGFSDNRPDFLALDPIDKIAEDLGFQNRASEEAEVLEVKRAHIQLHQWSPDRTGDGVPAARFQDLKQGWPFLARNKVDHDIDRICPKFAGVIGVPVQGPVCTKLKQGVGFCRARHRNDPGAPGPGQLDRRGADATGRAGDEHRVARLDARAFQHVFRR